MSRHFLDVIQRLDSDFEAPDTSMWSPNLVLRLQLDGADLQPRGIKVQYSEYIRAWYIVVVEARALHAS